MFLDYKKWHQLMVPYDDFLYKKNIFGYKTNES